MQAQPDQMITNQDLIKNLMNLSNGNGKSTSTQNTFNNNPTISNGTGTLPNQASSIFNMSSMPEEKQTHKNRSSQSLSEINLLTQEIHQLMNSQKQDGMDLIKYN